MSFHPIVVEKGDGLEEVAKKLITHNIGALPVVDEMGLVQGIITLKSISWSCLGLVRSRWE